VKTLVDNFSVLSIEKCLLQKLPEMFTPEIVIGLEEDQVERIAAESEESRAERSRATEKLTVLENTLKVLQSLDRHKASGKSFLGPSEFSTSNDSVTVKVEDDSSSAASEDELI
jgi:hypothetical protein